MSALITCARMEPLAWMKLLTTRAVALRVGKANFAPTELTDAPANFAMGMDLAQAGLQIMFVIAHLVFQGMIANTILRAHCHLPSLAIM